MSFSTPSTPTLVSTATVPHRPHHALPHTNTIPASRYSLKSPRPTHFLVRPTGEIVPMIAVDEFPPGTNLIGVSRTLDIEATIGMSNAGLIKKEKGVGYYAFKQDYYRKGAEKSVGYCDKQAGTTTIINSDDSIPLQSSGSDATLSSDEESVCKEDLNLSVPDNSPTFSSSSSSTHNTSTTPSDIQLPTSPKSSLPQTTLCRHWCHHGNCKWGQQCRYKHIMPLSVPGLSEVGLRDWPSWYRVLNPGYFVDSSIGLSQHNPQRSAVTGELRTGRRVMSGGGSIRRGALDVELGQEIVQRLRRMERERAAEKEKRDRECKEMMEDERRVEARKRAAEERRVREAGSVRGLAVQKAVEKGARRWADEESEDEAVMVAVKPAAVAVGGNKKDDLVEL